MKKNSFLILGIIFSLCSCKSTEIDEISGTWKSFVATKDEIKNIYNISITPFNTVMQINYFLEDNNKDNNDVIFQEVTDLYNSEVSRLHKLFDRHNKYYINDSNELMNNINVINESFGTNKAIKCDDDLYDLLSLGVQLYELTQGQFNMFTGSITDFWDYCFNEVYNYTLIEEIDPYFIDSQKERLETLVDSIPNSLEEINQQLTFDDENKTVTFNKCEFNNDIKPLISVGGIAKGFATDIIKQKLTLLMKRLLKALKK